MRIPVIHKVLALTSNGAQRSDNFYNFFYAQSAHKFLFLFFLSHPHLLAHDAFAHHAAGLEDELHPAFGVVFLENQGAAGPGFGVGLLVGVLAEGSVRWQWLQQRNLFSGVLFIGHMCLEMKRNDNLLVGCRAGVPAPVDGGTGARGRGYLRPWAGTYPPVVYLLKRMCVHRLQY